MTCSKLEAMTIYVEKSANANDILASVYFLLLVLFLLRFVQIILSKISVSICFMNSNIFRYFVIITLDLAICSFVSLFWCHWGFQSGFFSCWSHCLLLFWLNLGHSLAQFSSVLAEICWASLSLTEFSWIWLSPVLFCLAEFGAIWLNLAQLAAWICLA